MTKLQDKIATLHVIAGLMAKPERIGQREYQLDMDDFFESFHKIIYGAIVNLQDMKAEKINHIEIDGFLSNYATQYKIFNDNNGLDYLEKVMEIGESDNFEMHYRRLKKFSFLRECKKIGIDIRDIYDEEVVDLKEEKEQNDRFNEMSMQDMVKHIEVKMVKLRDSFLSESVLNGGHMSDNIDEIVESKTSSPNYGAPMSSQYLNAILRGSRKRKLNIKSAGTGTGKSRMGMANLAIKSIPEIYDIKKEKWIKTGATGKCLFITTELDEEEIKIPFLCYIAEVEEDVFQEGRMTAAETLRFERAKEILKKSPLWFEELSDFDIDDIESTIVKYITNHEIEYVEFDYIHTSLKLLTSLAEAGVKNLREDQVILLMGIALKNICNKYDIHTESSTQLNDKQNENNNMDQSWIRGSKALADKIDGGYIMLPMREKDQKIVDTILASGAVNTFGMQPNISLNVYKNRGGRHKMIRVWGYFNAGTLRFYDLFTTNYKGELVTNIERKEIKMSNPYQPEDSSTDPLPSFDF